MGFWFLFCFSFSFFLVSGGWSEMPRLGMGTKDGEFEMGNSEMGYSGMGYRRGDGGWKIGESRK